MLPSLQGDKTRRAEHQQLWFSSLENGGHRANHGTKLWRDRHIQVDIAQIFSLGAAGSINREGYLIGNCYELLETGCGL